MRSMSTSHVTEDHTIGCGRSLRVKPVGSISHVRNSSPPATKTGSVGCCFLDVFEIGRSFIVLPIRALRPLRPLRRSSIWDPLGVASMTMTVVLSWLPPHLRGQRGLRPSCRRSRCCMTMLAQAIARQHEPSPGSAGTSAMSTRRLLADAAEVLQAIRRAMVFSQLLDAKEPGCATPPSRRHEPAARMVSDDDRRQGSSGEQRAAPSPRWPARLRSQRAPLHRPVCADRRHERIDGPLRGLCAASVASHAVGDNKQARLSMVAVPSFWFGAGRCRCKGVP